MKFSSQEEYGLRCLLRIGKYFPINKALTIPEISQFEGITVHNAAKLLRILRINGFVESERGQVGGYTLSRPPEKIIVGEVLAALGGRLFQEDEFCNTHSRPESSFCTQTIDCSLKSLWRILQGSVDQVVNNLTLRDLLSDGQNGIESKFFSATEPGSF
jgi:Rrf2 family protein